NDPPDRLHKISIHGFVVIIKISPASQAIDSLSPFLSKSKHDFAAFFVVLSDAKLFDFLARFKLKLLIDLLLNGKSVAIPPPTPLHIVTTHRPVTGDDVFECARK